MKLRIKDTDVIQNLKLISINDKYLCDHEVKTIYGEPITLKTLNKYYQDYIPKDPLIKDEKIRKAVRAWAEANEIETVDYDDYWVSFRRDDKVISFKDEDSCVGFYGLDDNGTYTITELCGEEEDD